MITPRFLRIAMFMSLALALVSGSDRAWSATAPEVVGAPGSEELPALADSGCLVCHPLELAAHQGQSCTSCHGGNDRAGTREVAHLGLTANPAAGLLQNKCGSCHARQTDGIDRSRHFTLTGEVNPVRRHFGAERDLDSALEIPEAAAPESPLALADDLLRRRCLRCHVYYRGDDYGETRHGTGCAACHLDFRDGRLVSHRFLAVPDDRRCLACHYGNRVGGDYYGLFEHDYKDEYRTPFQPYGNYAERPYGIEAHRLQPDVHQLAGLTCLDCHSGLHRGRATTIACAACHDWRPGQALPAAHLEEKTGQLWLKTRAAGRWLAVPRAVAPAHAAFGRQVDCAVCHARWSYNDRGTHLLLTEVEDYQDWSDLIVQGSSEVEHQILTSLYGEGEAAPAMSDKLTGARRPGLWFQTYELRRWEDPPLGLDDSGRLRVMRPSLDLHLSRVDEQGQTVFDSIGGQGAGLRPYTPHTIGKAGPFYRQRLKGFNLAPTSGTSDK